MPNAYDLRALQCLQNLQGPVHTGQVNLDGIESHSQGSGGRNAALSILEMSRISRIPVHLLTTTSMHDVAAASGVIVLNGCLQNSAMGQVNTVYCNTNMAEPISQEVLNSGSCIEQKLPEDMHRGSKTRARSTIRSRYVSQRANSTSRQLAGTCLMTNTTAHVQGCQKRCR